MRRLVSSLVSASRGSGSRSKPLFLLPSATARTHASPPPPPPPVPSSLCRLTNSINAEWSSNGVIRMKMARARNGGILAGLLQQSRRYVVSSSKPSKAASLKGPACHVSYPPRTLASTSSSNSSQGAKSEERRKDIMTSEDPFDAPTYNIPEKPVTFTEGASYSIVILAGLGVAAAAAYAVFKELIFEPKEYKIFGKALERVQNDSQVRVRIGSPVTGYGQESMNRAARQRIPNRAWTDEDGIERVEVNFYIRGPRGAGKVYTEMFKDKVDKQWKYTYLIVEIKSPSPVQLMLESYVPA